MQNTLSGVAALMPAKLQRQHLHDMVVEHLRDMILTGALAAGSKLNERTLCEVLGISRTPLREALKALASEGLIELVPNRGASVATMSLQEQGQTFELMSALEALAGELACQRITAAEVAEIKAQHYAMLAAKAQNDLPAYYARNQAIHDLINQAARNDVLRHAYLAHNRRLQALRFKSNLNAAKWERAVLDHEQMISALEARDGVRLAAILRGHLLAKRDALLALAAEPAAVGPGDAVSFTRNLSTAHGTVL